MALPTQTNNKEQIKTGPGIVLFKECVDAATDLAALPTLTAASGVFTNSFTGWSPIGYTEEGITLTFGKDTEDIEVNETEYPISTVVTKQTGTIEFDVSGINQANLKLAMSGGSWSTSGTGAAQIATYTPPSMSAVKRVMFAFIGADSDEILIAYHCFQSGEVTMDRKKGADKAALKGLTLNMELPDSTVASAPYSYNYAGTWADDLAVES